jgi:hypothetical protein
MACAADFDIRGASAPASCAADFDVRGATAAATLASDFDVRAPDAGRVASVFVNNDAGNSASVFVYKPAFAFGAPSSQSSFHFSAAVDPATLMVDFGTMSLDADPPSPQLFDLNALCLDAASASAPPSPLPFDLSALKVSEQPTPGIAFFMSDKLLDELLAAEPSINRAMLQFHKRHEWASLFVIVAIGQWTNYKVLELLAAHGYNFNAFSGTRDESGATPLNHVVDQHPRLVRDRHTARHDRTFSIDRTLALIKWLMAHGADPSVKDRLFGRNMYEQLRHCCRYEESPEMRANYHTLATKLDAWEK